MIWKDLPVTVSTIGPIAVFATSDRVPIKRSCFAGDRTPTHLLNEMANQLTTHIEIDAGAKR